MSNPALWLFCWCCKFKYLSVFVFSAEASLSNWFAILLLFKSPAALFLKEACLVVGFTLQSSCQIQLLYCCFNQNFLSDCVQLSCFSKDSCCWMVCKSAPLPVTVSWAPQASSCLCWLASAIPVGATRLLAPTCLSLTPSHPCLPPPVHPPSLPRQIPAYNLNHPVWNLNNLLGSSIMRASSSQLCSKFYAHLVSIC